VSVEEQERLEAKHQQGVCVCVCVIMPRCACAAKAYGSLLVFLSVILSVTGIAAQRAIQVLKHAQMGTKPCFLRFKLARFFR